MVVRFYDPDPTTEHTPLTRADLEVLEDKGGRLLRDKTIRRHVLSRMRATLDEYDRRIRTLNDAVLRLQADLAARSTPVTQDPRSWLRLLPPEEVLAHVGGWLQQRWEELQARERALREEGR